ncbi:MAG: putative ATP/GTP-binding protein [Flavipsychrobacter sp.]|jgi:acyl carrier protein|nr:putative ATP/GTP-binding protein [Flavipsychrobacter sp.]
MKKKLEQDGKIITFYSYKGGVGRSMALANIAVLLAQWQYKVLIIDWDLEAPGLENFFKNFSSPEEIRKKNGLIDLLHGANEQEDTRPLEWQSCITNIQIEKTDLDLMTSGNRSEQYYEMVRSFDFAAFYEKGNGSNAIETFRKEWKKNYDFVLIDSRTGVTDIGGVCTIQLPDILVLLFTPTYQGFEGILRVAKSAQKNQKSLPFDRVNLQLLPVPTRIDNSEFILSRDWFDFFEKGLEELYESWLPEEIDRKDFLLNTKVPYISYFSFDEKLPVLEDRVNNPSSMGYSYQSIAALLATCLDYGEYLLFDRSKLIAQAQNPQHILEPINGANSSNYIRDLLIYKLNKYSTSATNLLRRKGTGVVLLITTMVFIFFYLKELETSQAKIDIDQIDSAAIVKNWQVLYNASKKTGRIVDANGNAVGQANILIKIRDTTRSLYECNWEMESDPDGNFVVPTHDISPGNVYTLVVKKTGLESFSGPINMDSSTIVIRLDYITSNYSRDEIVDIVSKIVSSKLGIDKPGIKASFTKELKGDDLDKIELILEFEKTFNISIPDADANQINTIAEAAIYIRKNLRYQAAH